MNIRPPVGIYRHHWDAMQVHTPRVVLGESAIDSMCLSYADMELAKDVLLGTGVLGVVADHECVEYRLACKLPGTNPIMNAGADDLGLTLFSQLYKLILDCLREP